jgi:hypothetical protein
MIAVTRCLRVVGCGVREMFGSRWGLGARSRGGVRMAMSIAVMVVGELGRLSSRLR